MSTRKQRNDDLSARFPGWETGGVNAWTAVGAFVLLIVVPCVIGVIQSF